MKTRKNKHKQHLQTSTKQNEINKQGQTTKQRTQTIQTETTTRIPQSRTKYQNKTNT